jgi:RNA polymerase sigma-70 factor (ECF subfamily)
VLFGRHSRAVYATAFAVIRNPRDAEELLSDAFLLLWRKRETIEFLGESLLPWLITTVRYLAKNKQRASRFSAILFDEAKDTGRAASLETTMELRDLSQQIETLVGALPPIDQRIVQLCLVDNLTYEQAAISLGLTHASVRNRLARSRKQLRDGLNLEGQLR